MKYKEFEVMEDGVADLMNASLTVENIKSENITRLRLTSGGGMGGACWYEYIKPISELPSNTIIKVKRYDDSEIQINTRFVVNAEDFVLTTATVDQSEWKAKCLFPEKVELFKDYRVLTKKGKKVTFKTGGYY